MIIRNSMMSNEPRDKFQGQNIRPSPLLILKARALGEATKMVVQTPASASPMSARRRRGLAMTMQTPTDNIACLEANNDEEERRQRKRSLLLSNNLLSPVAGHTTPKSRTASAADGDANRAHAGMTYAQLREHNANCIKLSSENKINAKNAFALHLIDYMKVLVTQSQKDDTTNFQSASCTLDAGVKIYAGRVDSVHADAYKMLGSLGRATVEEDENEQQTDGPEKQEKKKKTTRGPGKTIEKNLKSINCESFDLTFEVDPFFHKTSATFDEGGTSGLLINNLLVIDESYELALDSQTKVTMTEEPAKSTKCSPVYLAPFKDITSRLFENNIEICPQFRDFVFTEWDRDSQSLIPEHNDKTLPSNDNHRFDQDASILEPDAEDPGVDYASDGGYSGGADDDEMSTGSCADQGAITDIISGNNKPDGLSEGPFAGTGQLGLEFSLQPSEYSYFRQDILDTWAGPHHWKVRGKPTKAGLADGETSKKKRQKKVFTFNYDDDSLISGIEKLGKASKTLSKITLKKMSITNTTLPDDIHYEAENFLKLFIKPAVKIRRKFKSTVDGENDVYVYNYENRFDQDNFCPAFQNEDDDDDYGPSDDVMNNNTGVTGDSLANATHRGFDDTVGDQTFFGGDNLVSQPNKVEKINIAYAKTAKRIDIKKLKRSIWETLDFTEGETDKENVVEKSPRKSKPDTPEKQELKSFKEVYSVLPEKLSQNASKNLSVPIAFVCLLYLANEKGLELYSSDSMEDFKIGIEGPRTEAPT